MILKGILLILIGISGVVITMTWTFKSFNRANKNKSDFSCNGLEDSYYTSEISDQKRRDSMSLGFYLQRQEEKSTILLDDLVIDEETDETVLLEEEKLKSQ